MAPAKISLHCILNKQAYILTGLQLLVMELLMMEIATFKSKKETLNSERNTCQHFKNNE